MRNAAQIKLGLFCYFLGGVAWSPQGINNKHKPEIRPGRSQAESKDAKRSEKNVQLRKIKCQTLTINGNQEPAKSYHSERLPFYFLCARAGTNINSRRPIGYRRLFPKAKGPVGEMI